MERSGRVWALAAMLTVDTLLVISLTPLGFESRPTTALTSVGYLAIGTVFVGLLLCLVSLVLLFWRVRLAAILAIVGSVVLLFPNAVDQLGSFFSMPIPPVINTLEYVLTAALLVTLVVAWSVLKEREVENHHE